MRIIRNLGCTQSGTPVGVVDTPCRPNRYYSGLIRLSGTPMDNSTSNYYPTIEDAVAAATKKCHIVSYTADGGRTDDIV